MWMFPYMLRPYLPNDNNEPPTIYSLLNSIVNYGREDKVKIKDLAVNGRSTIFDFNYPLSNNINKEDFEKMILNKFMMRRIGFDTLTAFKLQLEVKLNEIMPLYNKLFDSLEGWDLFNDGEVTTREQIDSRSTNTSNSLTNTSNTTATSDRRYSELPQNEIENVRDGNYITDYNYDTNTGSDTSTANGTSNSSDSGNLNETIRRSPSDKISIYKEFIENKNNIYSMIFKDLESLFYQLV